MVKRTLQAVMVMVVALSLGLGPVCAAVSSKPWKTPCHKKTALNDGAGPSERGHCKWSPCHAGSRHLFTPPETGPRRGQAQPSDGFAFLDADLTRNATGPCRPPRFGLFVPDLFADRSPALFVLHQAFLS